ncbi:MAG: hypothetical protein PHG66_03005 [Candidatus Colwellbacteria bacterium]|nr:hypothetical protein [Candidatus Colwellbacteria bacterium]
MAEKYRLEKVPGGGFGITWTGGKMEGDCYLRAIKASTDAKELKEKNRRVPKGSQFSPPQSLGEISVDLRNGGMARMLGEKAERCLGVILYENNQKTEFTAPVLAPKTRQ